MYHYKPPLKREPALDQPVWPVNDDCHGSGLGKKGINTMSEETATQTTETPAASSDASNVVNTVASVGTDVAAAAAVASVATGNPEIEVLAQVAATLATAIASLIASGNAPSMTDAGMQVAWANMGSALGAGISAFMKAK